MSYRLVGSVVRYVCAERGGAEEEIPAALVDFDATRRWEQQHAVPSRRRKQKQASPRDRSGTL